MRNCPNCGAPIADNDLFCGNCGTRSEVPQNITFEDPIKGFNPDKVQEIPRMQPQYSQPAQNTEMQQSQAMYSQSQMQYSAQEPARFQQSQQFQQPQQMQYQQPYYGTQHPQQGLITAIKIFLVLSCIFSAGALFIPLLWRLPMTIVAYRKMDAGEPLGLAFKICALLFVGFIPGILMLALNDDVYI